ncbi:MAG: hypothetical protein REI09_00055 [Candidatus Dactylopiibacterium sp.]|nr:hypothetical protein [Candidatus Dactylopiibacterium sp.]
MLMRVPFCREDDENPPRESTARRKADDEVIKWIAGSALRRRRKYVTGRGPSRTDSQPGGSPATNRDKGLHAGETRRSDDIHPGAGNGNEARIVAGGECGMGAGALAASPVLQVCLACQFKTGLNRIKFMTPDISSLARPKTPPGRTGNNPSKH